MSEEEKSVPANEAPVAGPMERARAAGQAAAPGRPPPPPPSGPAAASGGAMALEARALRAAQTPREAMAAKLGIRAVDTGDEIDPAVAAALGRVAAPPPQQPAAPPPQVAPAEADRTYDYGAEKKGPPAEESALPAGERSVQPDAEDAPEPERPKARPFTVAPGSIMPGSGSLEAEAAIAAALQRSTAGVYKVTALQSGYTAELSPLSFSDIAKLQASAIDGHAARMKLYSVLHGKITKFGCGAMKFKDWLRVTSQGDYDTLMYGLYAATYPGDNQFDVPCRHCGQINKITTDVNQLAVALDESVHAQARALLESDAVDPQAALQNSMVGKEFMVELPKSKIVAAIRSPSMQDYLDGVLYYTQITAGGPGGLPPAQLAGADTIRTVAMYVSRFLVPTRGSPDKYTQITDVGQRHSLVSRLGREDGVALGEAIDEHTKKTGVNFKLPNFNCVACVKPNTDLFVNFENLLFTKLQAST